MIGGRMGRYVKMEMEKWSDKWFEAHGYTKEWFDAYFARSREYWQSEFEKIVREDRGDETQSGAGPAARRSEGGR
jgi:hypothetical protein